MDLETPGNGNNKDWKNLFDNAPCGFLITSPGGKISVINTTLLSWLGYTRPELEGKQRFQDLLPIGGKLFFETQHITLIKIQGKVEELNYDLIAKNGDRIPVLVNSTLQKNDNGEVKSLHFAIFPFSDRKKYEKELLIAKKKAEIATEAKSTFLSTISHEIKTPIHAIVGASDFLIQDYPRESQMKLLRVLRLSALTLLDLVNDILDLSKIEAGKLVLEERLFDLRELMSDLAESFHYKVKAKNLSLNLTFQGDLAEFYVGDMVKIGQIVTNLVSNAIKFTNKGYIELKIKAEPDLLDRHLLHFSVSDTGIGIKAENLKKIFDPFTQSNSTIHNEFGGTGLGLTIAQKLLNAYRSELQVKSKFGEGTVFSFTLKLKASSELDYTPPSEIKFTQLEQLSDIRVLVVDDIQSNLFIITRYLKQWGLQYDLASSGEQALQLVKQKDFDIILMDLKMPQMDGYETTRHIRSLPQKKYRELPIIALSALATSEVNTKMVENGLNALIQKPFNPVRLHQTIREFCLGSQNTAKESLSDRVPEAFISTKYAQRPEPDLKQLQNLFDNDRAGIKNYLQAVVKDVDTIIEDFAQLDSTLSLRSFRDAAHKSVSIVRIFQLDTLAFLFKKGKELLSEGRNEEFLDISAQIKESLRQFLFWVEQKIEEQE